MTIQEKCPFSEALHRPETYSSDIVVPQMPPAWRAKFAGLVGEHGTLIGYDNPDHDRLRSSAANEYMMTCVSRSLGPSLVVDL